MNPVHLFAYKLLPPRPSFGMDMTDAEAAVMGEHAAYWQGHVDAGKVVLFGPVFDSTGTWGLAIVRAGSEDEVTELGQADPAVTSNTCTFEVGTMPATILPPG